MGRFSLALSFVFVVACHHDGGAPADMSAPDLAVARCLYVDDLGVTHGCIGGGQGPGDRDDGGGMPEVGPPDQGADLMNLPFASPCLDNGQCASNICYEYRVKGQFCTLLCAQDSDCPPPSPGCGGMYVCRMPDSASY